MNAGNSRLMHGTDWCGQNVSGWWWSEKLDGWRCLWTGSEFETRGGSRLDAPAWFLAGMPATPLDGELWAGRGRSHDDVARAVRSGRWADLQFRPFDVPILSHKIEASIALLASLPLPRHAQPVEYRRVDSTAEALAILHRVARDGGEGIMLRKPGAGYAPGYRTASLLKLKGAMRLSG